MGHFGTPLGLLVNADFKCGLTFPPPSGFVDLDRLLPRGFLTFYKQDCAMVPIDLDRRLRGITFEDMTRHTVGSRVAEINPYT